MGAFPLKKAGPFSGPTSTFVTVFLYPCPQKLARTSRPATGVNGGSKIDPLPSVGRLLFTIQSRRQVDLSQSENLHLSIAELRLSNVLEGQDEAQKRAGKFNQDGRMKLGDAAALFQERIRTDGGAQARHLGR